MIEIQNLTRDYGDNKGIFNLSLDIPQGEVFGFLGPNGAGKTTTIRHLMGFLRAKQGMATIDGLDCFDDAAEIQRRVGYIPGEMTLFDDMTGNEYLAFIAKYRNDYNPKYIIHLLKAFDVNPNGKIKKMSKGMKQKIGIVAAFMHNPNILILDEPTSGLDPLMQSQFIELILEEKKKGKTILMSSHMFEEVEKTADRIGIIKQGKLVTVDTVENIKSTQTKKYIINFENAEDVNNFLSEPFETKNLGENKVEVAIQNNLQDLIASLAKFHIQDLSTSSQSLEEVFMHYFGGENYA